MIFRYKICRDCYLEAQTAGLCPGCKEPYITAEHDDDEAPNFSYGNLSLPAPEKSKTNSNMTMMKRNQNGEFDHNKWLFETQGTYGYGNAYWPQDGIHGGDVDDRMPSEILDNSDKPWKPLSRVIPIPTEIISPYR